MIDHTVSGKAGELGVNRWPRKWLVLVGLVLILALALPAMAKHRAVGGEVTAIDFEFLPEDPDSEDPEVLKIKATIEQGTNVRFINDGPIDPHTLSSDDFLFESGAVLPGRNRVVNTERLAAGTYTFFCGFHPFMTGTLVVEG